jgi:hypothetical protein
MPQASNEIVIERPPSEVFAFLANPENARSHPKATARASASSSRRK